MTNQRYTSLDDFATWELEAYADGEPLPHVTAFFEQHPDLYQAWQKGQQRITVIKAGLHRFDCPAPERLHAYVWGELSPTVQHSVAAHMKSCPHCAAEFANLQAFLQADAPVTSMPAAAQAATPSIWEQLHALAEKVQITVANLVTMTPPPLAGVALRSDAPQPGIQNNRQTTFLFETETVAISLLVERTSINALQVAGQLLGVEPLSNGLVRITSADPAVAPQGTPVDEVGNFVFSQLPLGAYQLIITFPGQTIIIPNLNFA